MATEDGAEPRPPELDAELSVCGEVFFFRRSLGLMRRLEQRFGALFPLGQRLERFQVTISELSGIVEEVIRGADGPKRWEIEHWLFRDGVHATSKALALVMYEMTVGHDKLRAQEEKRRLATEDTRNPTRPAASAGAA